MAGGSEGQVTFAALALRFDGSDGGVSPNDSGCPTHRFGSFADVTHRTCGNPRLFPLCAVSDPRRERGHFLLYQRSSVALSAISSCAQPISGYPAESYRRANIQIFRDARTTRAHGSCGNGGAGPSVEIAHCYRPVLHARHTARLGNARTVAN